MASKLFRTKNPDQLIREASSPERRMKRALTAFDLTCLGIGAIIGAGIFALAGTAAAGEQFEASVWKTPVLNFIQSAMSGSDLIFGRPGAGPAVMLSFVVAAVACGFAALCYGELAAMIPVSGSAYTYSYATLGEIVAWVIGWDLILEYAVGNMAVAVGWSGYFVSLCASAGLRFPLWLVSDHATALTKIAQGSDALQQVLVCDLAVDWRSFDRRQPSGLCYCCSRYDSFNLWNSGEREDQQPDCYYQGLCCRFRYCFRRVHGQSTELEPIHADRLWRRHERCRHCLFCFHRL